MGTASAILELLNVGLGAVAKARELWVKEGLDPDEFDALVAKDRSDRQATIDAQKAAELAKLGGK